MVKESNEISLSTITKYCETWKVSQEHVAHILEKKGYRVAKCNNFTLSESQQREFEMKYRNKPYGDIKLRTRLVFIP